MKKHTLFGRVLESIIGKNRENTLFDRALVRVRAKIE